MSWTSAPELRAQVQRVWDRGQLLASIVTGDVIFPIRLTLKTPSSADITGRFDAVRSWIAELLDTPHIRVEMRQFRHQVFGENTMPAEVWVDSLAEAVALLGKEPELIQFSGVLAHTSEHQPSLLSWLADRPLRALALAPAWPRLLAVVAWLQTHPHSGVYLRQIDIPGVHTKFIEAHRSVLVELLDRVLPVDQIDALASGPSQFARRYGLRDKLLRVRFRALDPAHCLLPVVNEKDITLDAEAFARLTLTVKRVFITENEINFLALPDVPDSIAIFGAGYGFDALADATWLSQIQIHYWGDIDTHGFAILDQLRALYPHALSFLMDRATLMAFSTLWGEETQPLTRDLQRLNLDEMALFDDIRQNRIGHRLRLEQEQIGFEWVKSAMSRFV